MVANTEKDNVISKIRKLLALAGSPNQHEAAAAASKAQEFLNEHKLSMIDVEVGSEIRDVTAAEILYADGVWFWKPILLKAIAETSYCKAFIGTSNLFVVGKTVDVAVTLELYNWLLEQVNRVADQSGLTGDLTTRESFSRGCVLEISKRLRWDFHIRTTGGARKNRELVVSNKHDIDEFLNKNDVEVEGTVKGNNENLDPIAFLFGANAGARVELKPQHKLESVPIRLAKEKR